MAAARVPYKIIEVDDGAFNYDPTITVEMSQKDSRDYWIRPIGGVVNQKGPFIFNFQATPDKYLMLRSARLELVCRVTRGDGSPLNMLEDIVAPVNLLGACMWETVEVSLNGRPLSGAAGMNAGYKAYLESMLTYDQDGAKTHLHTMMYHLDSPNQFENMKVNIRTLQKQFELDILAGKHPRPIIQANLQPDPAFMEKKEPDTSILLYPLDAVDPVSVGVNMPNVITPADQLTEQQKRVRRRQLYRELFKHDMQILIDAATETGAASTNLGFDERYHIVSRSDSFDMYSIIPHDFFKMDNHLTPGNTVELKLYRYSDAFLLNSYMGDLQKFTLHIDDMRLHLRAIQRKERIIPNPTECYRMNETRLHKRIVPAGTPTITFRIHSGSVMPKTILLAMVAAESAEGSYLWNPWHFYHFFVKNVALVIDTVVYPEGGLEFDFTRTNPLAARGYSWIFENSGRSSGEKGNIISWPAFKSGTFIIPFDLEPDKCNGEHDHEAQYGDIDVRLEFSHQTTYPIYVLYEMMFPRVLSNFKTVKEHVVSDVMA